MSSIRLPVAGRERVRVPQRPPPSAFALRRCARTPGSPLRGGFAAVRSERAPRPRQDASIPVRPAPFRCSRRGRALRKARSRCRATRARHASASVRRRSRPRDMPGCIACSRCTCARRCGRYAGARVAPATCRAAAAPRARATRASATISVSPPGGQRSMSFVFAAMASAYGRHPSYPQRLHCVCGSRSSIRSARSGVLGMAVLF